MKNMSFLHGALFALAASVLGSVLHTALAPLFGNDWTLRLLIALLGLAYTLFLLQRSGQRVGRLVTVSTWLLMATGLWLTQPPIALYLLAHLAALWLIRSLYFHAGALSALADMALHGIALASGFWAASHTHSLFLSLWCFFLVQALFVALPTRLGSRARQTQNVTDAPFARAHRAAEGAVRKLTTHH